MRRIGIPLSSLVVVFSVLMTAEPSAFAMYVGPGSPGGPPVAVPVAAPSGLSAWEVALIVVAGVVVVGLAVGAVLIRASRRGAPTTAVGRA
ncbi:MAG: hypothetical protein FWC87_14895 [Acidimicrobiaceae bacterium]|nr:hypothetical protein [Acidimicrobiaceae bacterium]